MKIVDRKTNTEKIILQLEQVKSYLNVKLFSMADCFHFIENDLTRNKVFLLNHENLNKQNSSVALNATEL